MASKPYALFTHSDEGDIVVRKASEHGLGHLLNPIDPEKTSKEWIELLWKQIILEEQRKPTNRPLWFDSLAVSKESISTPRMLAPFQRVNKRLSYIDRIKPMNFYLAPLGNRAPIVQGREDLRWQNGRRTAVRRSTALDGQARAALVISLLKGETTAAEAARRHGLKVAEVEESRERFLLGAENALRARPKEDETLREEELNRLKRKVGELTIDLDILREANRLRPTTPGTSDE